MEERCYLCFDLSTQSLKAIVANHKLDIIHEDSINFDKDLPEFHTENGVTRHNDGCTITSPTLMWVKAVDLLLMKMMTKGVDFSKVVMISGTGQQHGSVYWKNAAELTLTHLDENSTLVDQLQDCFVISNSPVWMDSSTTKQCKDLEQAAGGSMHLSKITGSKAYERFTGNQIAKIYQTCADEYRNCERICLVSSFLATLFIGKYAPIDFSDGSGMNLLNINTKEWDASLMKACAPGLKNRLGVPVASSSVIGKVSKYMRGRYNFPSSCEVIAFTGDNPSSLAGMRLDHTDVAVSLGTSDTLMFWSESANPSTEGHVFVNPLDKEKYMAMLCFKNGSLSREKICTEHCKGSWEEFNQFLKNTPAGNGGKIGIYFDEMEILPHVKGVHKWNENGDDATTFESAEEVRAVIEGQFLAKRYHAQMFGFKPTESSRILATGGASENTVILQVLCDVFNLPVYTLKETSNSACLGGIYRCKQASIAEGTLSYLEAIKDLPPHRLVYKPNQDHVTMYERMLDRYRRLEQSLVS